jgi:hypothetical protein
MSEEKIRSIEDVETQLLEKVIRMAQQTGSSLSQVVVYEIIRGLKAKGLERVSILTNALLLVTFDEAERERLNKIKLIAGRLDVAKKYLSQQWFAVELPYFCFNEIEYLVWLDNIDYFYVRYPPILEDYIKEQKKQKEELIVRYKKTHPNATNREINLLAKAVNLSLFSYPPIELIINDFVAWADNIIFQKISRILSGGGESEDKVVNGE